MAISTVSDPSGSGRVDMLTSPVAAARAAVVTGAWVKSKHDMYLIRGVWELKLYVTHPPEDKKIKTNAVEFKGKPLSCLTGSTRATPSPSRHIKYV